MQLHTLQPTHKSRGKKRIGRGGKRGTYSGKGIKGQSSRAGRKIRPGTRDLIQQIPKLRGSRNIGPKKRSKKQRGAPKAKTETKAKAQ
ncbi:MAG: hypothetical protein A2119_02275 [Candidatus Colwellbacteria bacterium GWA2_46_10]|uniref:50S ribosomal protein L15 n=1 Tax=Candidatus Colwellbacteria bacterium GWA2_46_10 TaxID=1797684 RepID=A0A1G1YX16_9BACT|nr:MAG: hypothetical protein UX29_C0012G0004 [Parcubacteria group bacterium GW2011_GWA2_46_10]OGY56931.1 MAG: hypothetical protein A2119_02275 [Candidatus Colwellbacteria bacterium GWA2_46_10]